MVVDQDYQDEEMFSQSAQKDQDLESDIDMIDEEIQRKNERIIQLELMLEEKQDWFNLKTQMVKKLEGELNYVHARHPERFTFDDAGTSLVPKSLEQTLKDLEREEREETFRTTYMPVYHRETEAFGECFSFDYKKKSFPLKPDPIPRKHIRPSHSSFIQREGNRKFLVSGHLGETELLPDVTEACDLERFSEIPANESLTGLDDLKVTYAIENLTRTKNSQYDEDCDWKDMTSINIAYELKLDKQVNFDENQTRKKSGESTPKKPGIITNEPVEKNWWQGGDTFNMWRTRPKLGRPTSPRPFNDKNQADHANVVELINGNNQFNTVSGTAKNPPTETSKEHVLKKSLSMESVFEGDGTKMRPSFKWRQMGDECVSLEKYIHVYTRNPEDLYEAVKKRAIEKEEEEDYEENELYHKEIKASLIGIDETKMKSNLRILDNFIREEEEKEKAKSTPKQVNSDNADEAIDGTLNEKESRAEEEKTVLQPDQTGSCYEDIHEKKKKEKANKSELKQVHTENVDKAAVDVSDNKSELKQVHTENVDQAAVDVSGNDKIKDEKEKIVLLPDQTGSCYEDTDGTNEVDYEKKINTCFDIIFEKPKKRMSKPKLSSENRKTANLMPNVLDQNIKRNENKEDVKLEEKKINTSFDIMLEKPKKHTSKPKLSSEKRKTFNLMSNVTEPNIKSNENIEDVKLKEKKVNTSFDIMFDSPKKKKSRKRKQNTTVDDNEIRKEENHEKLPIVPSKTTEVNLSNGEKLGGKFTNGKLRGKFTSDVIRKDNNEIRFRFSFLHCTTTIPSRIPLMVRYINGENTSLTRLNNERPRVNSARSIPVRVLKVTNTNRATMTGPLAVRSFPESNTSSEDKRKIDEDRRLLAPLSRIPIPKDRIRRPSDCIIPRLDPNEHLPKISHDSCSKREEQAKLPEANRNLGSPNLVSICEKGEKTCPGSTSELLQLPSIPTQNAMVKTSHPVSTSGLTRHTQIHGRKDYLDENKIVSPSVMATLPPIIGRSDTYINRPFSASGFAKLPPINSTNKTIEMDRPRSSARLSPLFTAFENTEHRPLSACGSPKLPPIIDGNTIEMRPTSSLSGYTLLPPIQSYKRGSVEDEKSTS
ncbi:Hypothetical predicted protein [Mytilus galloprovincialis]|uniref:Uncharacterized protein n=1 Tax=Mytilus galloprovincialis TaxID=29158 RepID=A0A8B6G203_MYTGA|nr:Hypothetical predicted protein [Mytilus galloprovincialis]